MKTSHKSIEKNTKNPIDGYVKRNIDLLNLVSPPTLFWDKNDSWNTIKSKIKSADRKVIAWGMALAATVSMTIAASIQLNITSKIEHKPSEIIEAQSSYLNSSKDTYLKPTYKKAHHLNSIIPKDNFTTNNSDISIPEIKVSHIAEYSIQDNLNYNTNSFNKIINPYFTLGTRYGNLKPEVGIEITLLNIKKNIKSKNINLGLSTEFIAQKSEQKSNFTPYHFVTLTFENINTLNNKGWSIKTGLLLNPDSNYYKDKLVLSKKVNEWLKIGPELIFTNGLKNIYPSLSISLG